MNSRVSAERRFSIKQLSDELNIPKPTLRFWEKELNDIIVPQRTSGGQRRYNQDQVNIIREIKRNRDIGKSLAEIKEIFGQSTRIIDEALCVDEIDALSNRIAEAVRNEISRFFQNKQLL